MMPHGEFFEIGVAEALAQKPELQEETVRTTGTSLNMLVHVAAAMAEEVEFEGAQADAAGFLDTARGDALTRYVASEYGIARHGPTSAIVELVVSRTSGDDYAELVPGFVVQADGVRFALDTLVAWEIGDVTDKVVFATSVMTGPENNVQALRTWTAESSPPEGVSFANPARAAGGNIDEGDEALIARVRDVGSRAVRGTLTAIRLGALEVAEVREVSVFESLDANGAPSGGVFVVISDGAGNGNAALVAKVRAELGNWRPAGCAVEIFGATPRIEPISGVAVWEPGQATAANVAVLRDALRARVNRLVPRSGTPAEVECLLSHAVLTEVRPLVPGLRQFTPTVPVGTIEPAVGEVIRAGTITVT